MPATCQRLRTTSRIVSDRLPRRPSLLPESPAFPRRSCSGRRSRPSWVMAAQTSQRKLPSGLPALRRMLVASYSVLSPRESTVITGVNTAGVGDIPTRIGGGVAAVKSERLPGLRIAGRVGIDPGNASGFSQVELDTCRCQRRWQTSGRGSGRFCHQPEERRHPCSDRAPPKDTFAGTTADAAATGIVLNSVSPQVLPDHIRVIAQLSLRQRFPLPDDREEPVPDRRPDRPWRAGRRPFLLPCHCR